LQGEQDENKKKTVITNFASSVRYQFYPNEEQNDRADDRHDETRRMKRGTWFGFGKEAADQSADDRPTDAKQGGQYETEMLCARHNGARDQPNDEADNNVPNDV
jgi:hypothetical protein